jgi:hypothetical protein
MQTEFLEHLRGQMRDAEEYREGLKLAREGACADPVNR